jgi:DNA-binding beta-propeller fold protein YncE
MDSSGTYLYVLDKYSPGLNAQTGLYDAPNTDGMGSITVFAADPTSGRLTLVTNASIKVNSINIPFFEVGPSPFMMKALAGCVYTVNAGNQQITPLVVGTAGQLSYTAFGNIIPQGTNLNLTSINGSGSYIFLTDSNNNQILGFQSSGTCNLAPLSGGVLANIPGTSNPVYSMLDTKSEYLYILNGSTTSTITTTPYSSISGFVLNASNQELTQIDPGVTFSVGSGPVCMVEDPSSQYMYVSNHNDGTITGKAFESTTGELTQLKRGSTFPTVGQPGCLVISGSID